MKLNVSKIVACASFAVAAVATSTAKADPRTHDGFQLRIAPGFGYLSDSESVADVSGSVHGVAGAFELYLGGGPAPGLTVGGMLDGTVAPGPTASFGGQSVTAGSNVHLNFFFLGPYVDYYIDPTSGFHFMGTVGFASINADNGSSSSAASNGFGLGLGAGYDWWVGDQWSIGVMGRFTYAHMTHDTSGISVTDNAIAPAVFATFNYQ